MIEIKPYIYEHDLLGSMDMLRYGHYMFYLANLLYFRGRKFLEMGEEKDRFQKFDYNKI